MHFVLRGEPLERLDIGLRAFAAYGRTRLGREQERVADGYANRFVADVQGHNPHIFDDTGLYSRRDIMNKH
jgi:hypothetical protein